MTGRLFAAAVLGLAGVLLATAWAADDWSASGWPSNIYDGDSFVLQGERVRLYGIDAPEFKQRCTNPDGSSWPCGIAARDALKSAIKGTVTCEAVGDKVGRYGRRIAVCTADGVELNGLLIDLGLAVANVRYGDAYVAREAAARSRAIGIWAGSFVMPWDWRKSRGRNG